MDTTSTEGNGLIAARARETALREILDVIARSRDDEQPVFEAIIENARNLCEAKMAAFVMGEEGGGPQVMVANRGATEETLQIYRDGHFPMDPEISTAARAIITRRTIHLPDMADTELYRQGHPNFVSLVDRQGIRTNLLVPLISHGRGIGCLILFRDEVRPYSDDQIQLVETFAAQAVIAIENVRQFRELQTRLEREGASREILQVISRNRDDATPVFDILLRTAQRLCGASNGAIVLGEEGGGPQILAAQTGASEETLERYRAGGFPMDPAQSLAARAIVEQRTLHFDDVARSAPYREGMAAARMHVEKEGIRSSIYVPLISNGKGIGCLNLLHRQQRTYSDDEIALVETFAAQAVIAIENVRQFRELQTRLEREAATREILEVISRSRDDEQPVFQIIVDHAAALCGAHTARLHLADPEATYFKLSASWGPDLTSYPIGHRFPLSHRGPVSSAINECRVVSIDDLSEAKGEYEDDEHRVRLIERDGVHSYLTVPLVSGGRALGAIALGRQVRRSFAPDEVALVETFAAQAVIAIENVRQFRELRTRLEREKASRETLQVISRSRDDDMPVFETILENACRLCNAPLAYLSMVTEDGAFVVSPARRGAFESFGVTLDNLRVPLAGSRLALARSIAECRVIRMDDIADDDVYRAGDPNRVSMVEDEGARSLLTVPLVSDGFGIGSITLYRREVAPFSDDDVALVEGFAAQAVIAIENVRQFRELQTRLEREAASREILQVISRSRDDEGPVFEAVLKSAARLCGASKAGLMIGRPDSAHVTLAAVYDPDFRSEAARDEMIADVNDPPMHMDPDKYISARSICGAEIVQVEDLAQSAPYLAGEPTFRSMVDVMGSRSVLCVPLQGDTGPVGAIMLHRNEVRPFADDQIALVETFAAQAVIAIENVRQFKALEARTEEVQALNASLEERVEEQVGEIERMGKLKSFLPAAVADAVVSSGAEKMLKSHRALLGILFCDIRGFTAFCETAEPEETIEVLQTYHQEMGRLLAEHGAGVDHRMGDGIMVLFNDPLPCDDPAGDAVRLAMAMREKMVELCARWKKLGHRLGFGVGISLGYATVGMVGYEGRSDYTASGTAVNLAARLCDHAEDGEILLSPRAAIAVEDEVVCEPGGVLELKGLSAPVEVMRAVGLR